MKKALHFLFLDQNNRPLILYYFHKEKTHTLILESFLLALADLLKFYMDSSGVKYRCSLQESVRANQETCKDFEECEVLVTRQGARAKTKVDHLFNVLVDPLHQIFPVKGYFRPTLVEAYCKIFVFSLCMKTELQNTIIESYSSSLIKTRLNV